MRRTHLGVQAAIVLAMVALVSYPQFRSVRAQSVWRYVPQAVLAARANDAARFAGDARTRSGMAVTNSAAFETAAGAGVQNALTGAAGAMFYTPLDVAAAGGKVNALLGVARNSLNMPIPYARVVLRNVRTGMVLGRTLADARGLFQFLDLEANGYVVELLGADGAVVAASPIVTMARGAVRQTEVRVAATAATVTASLGDTLTPTAPQVTTIASSNDVTRTTTQQTTAVSPR